MIATLKAGFRSTIAEYAEAGAALPERLAARVAESPDCPVTRYLLGCAELDRARPATAARHFMVAYHAEPQLQSAWLLVFTGMNWVQRRSEPLLAVLSDAWNEYRRPAFDESARERQLLDAFAEAPPTGVCRVPMGAKLWRLPIARLRSELRAAWDAAARPT